MNGDMGIGRYREDVLTDRIISCVIHVHETLGPGFLESIYRHALLIELLNRGLSAETEKEVIVYYKGQEVGIHRLDLVVEKKVILELKTVERLGKAHYAQVRSYLKATNLKLALLINFSLERSDFRRIQF
jgi:GxxExxY protein